MPLFEIVIFLCPFFAIQKATKEIKSVELVLKPGVAPEQRRRKPTVHAKQVTKQGENSNNKLLMAVFDFIRNSHGLELIMLDNVNLTNEQLAKLSEAMSATHSSLNKIVVMNCPIGSHGLRILTPAINKLHTITQVTVKGCGISDDGVNFFTSILRASVAHMDQLYWNSTLRMSDPIDGSLDSSTSGAVMNEETSHVFSSGLVVLDVSDNELTSGALQTLSRQLKNNHWLLALDLSGNKIDEAGLVSLANTLSAGENSALGTVLVRGNPGFCKASCDKLQEVTDAASDRLDCMPADLYEVLKELGNMRLEEAASANGITADPTKQGEGEGEGEGGGRNAGEVSVEAGETSASMPPAGALTPHFPSDVGAERPASAGSGRGEGMEMDMEFSIPTPVDGDTTTFQGSPLHDPASSPAAQLLAGDSSLDGRPPSRGSLRPRPQPGAGAGIFSPASTAGASISVSKGPSGGTAGNRRKVNRGSAGAVARTVGAGGRGVAVGDTHPGIRGLDSVDLLNGPGLAVDRGAISMATSFQSGARATGRASSESAFWAAGPPPPPLPSSSSTHARSKDRAPFYPGGASSAYQKARDGVTPNPRVRAAKYAEQVRMMQLCMPPPAPIPRARRRNKRALNAAKTAGSTGIAKGVMTANAMAQTAAAAPKHASSRDSGTGTGTGGETRSPKTDRKLEQLTGAVEKVTRQLEITAEKIADLSDSLSESVVNLSLNSSRLHNTTDITSGSLENGASAGDRDKAAAKAAQRKGSTDSSPSPSRHGGASKDSARIVSSSLTDAVEAPSPVKFDGAATATAAEREVTTDPSLSPSRTSGNKQGTRSSPGGSPGSSPSRTKNRDKDVSRSIRNSMREKLDKYLDELQF